MKDTPEFNIRLVTLIEKYPVVYDHTSAEYSNRNLQDKAWENIAKEINQSGK